MPVFSDQSAALVSAFLSEYAKQKGFFMPANYVNPEHVHALVELPSALSVEQMGKFLKGASSYWINKEGMAETPFNWQRGFGAFSVSDGKVKNVMSYIANQKVHHQNKTFSEEWSVILERAGLKMHADEGGELVSEDEAEWVDAETVETVSEILRSTNPALKRGAM